MVITASTTHGIYLALERGNGLKFYWFSGTEFDEFFNGSERDDDGVDDDDDDEWFSTYYDHDGKYVFGESGQGF
ncbi:BZ3500_MvSof-1268-A1-R1_Chr2-1g04628 [Microbotryum saponariae]|uniref:BZ3500_MvSof-1268-A1-R1_Chr2-1g04628 protein n=1 Tax=Microbotryum saponariae TaxID=289078 RepID=A0A2X0KZU4_9BASI|nr:BZ3500_MvSof-1268-A1-R1_Chr2-1g04628 [Microbotryum saponariae]SCZ92148.1 BZ3501_MvSof-1269-A2-R1_Chr2-1g04284 [Microbotryum saponariae]